MKVTPQNTFQTISQVMLADVFPIVVDLDRSEGNYLVDAVSGRRFLDCFSYIASNPIGHNHPGMFEPEFEKKLLRAARAKPSSSDVYTVEFAEFVQRFRILGMPAPYRHLFLVEGGAVAVENAMKTAFDWKIRKNQAKNIQGEKGKQILHFEQAFHGRCGYTLSVTNTNDPKKTKLFPKFDWPRIKNPKMSFPFDDAARAATEEQEAIAEAQIREAFRERGDDIAAILIEPIQGEGGDNHFRPEFHTKLRELANEFEVMLIHDEIQCGGGMTGMFWAHQHYSVEPDIICFGKKLQVCGIVVGPRVDEVENNVFQEKSRINSTWGGSLVDMVRATRYLEIIEEEDLLQNVSTTGAVLLDSLHQLQRRFPDWVGNVRGKGFFCSFDLRDDATRDAVLDELFRREVIVLKCGEKSLRLRPSLNFSEKDVGEFSDRLHEAVQTVIAAK